MRKFRRSPFLPESNFITFIITGYTRNSDLFLRPKKNIISLALHAVVMKSRVLEKKNIKVYLTLCIYTLSYILKQFFQPTIHHLRG